MFDFFAINTIKETNPKLYEFINENAGRFVICFREEVPNGLLDLELFSEKQNWKSTFIDNYFEKDKQFFRYKTFLNVLFPESTNRFGSADGEEMKKANLQKRICSGRYFRKYVGDSDQNKLIRASSSIEKALKEAKTFEELSHFFDGLFKAHSRDEHSELLKIIEQQTELISKNRACLLDWIYSYFEKKYFEFGFHSLSFSLPARDRCAVLLDEMLIALGKEKAVKKIKRFSNIAGKSTLLASLRYWNNKTIKNSEKGQELSEALDFTVKSTAEYIVSNCVNVFAKNTYRRSVLWRLKENVPMEALRKYIKKVVTPNNVLRFLNEFIATGTRWDDEKPYILSIDKKTIEMIISFADLSMIVVRASCKTENDKVIKSMFDKLRELPINSEKQDCEEYFETRQLLEDDS